MSLAPARMAMPLRSAACALNGSSGVRYGGEAFAELLSRTSIHSDAEAQFLAPHGITMPAQEFALICRRHMVRYGTTHEQLGAVATTCRDHATRNPRAQMQKPMGPALGLPSMLGHGVRTGRVPPKYHARSVTRT